MSPAMNAAWPLLLDVFGGRQSARSIHFICAFALVAFFFVHMAMVVLAGPINEVRSMITGKYKLPGKADPQPEPELPQGEPV
jgi:thiosulfate reductase cytochrome b subunit